MDLLKMIARRVSARRKQKQKLYKNSFNFMELTQFIMRARQLQIQLQIIFILQIN